MNTGEVLSATPAKRMKNTNCRFSLVVKLLKSFTDYNSIVIIEWNHNHSVTAFHTLSFRDIPIEVCIFVLFSFYSERTR